METVFLPTEVLSTLFFCHLDYIIAGIPNVHKNSEESFFALEKQNRRGFLPAGT